MVSCPPVIMLHILSRLIDTSPTKPRCSDNPLWQRDQQLVPFFGSPESVRYSYLVEIISGSTREIHYVILFYNAARE